MVRVTRRCVDCEVSALLAVGWEHELLAQVRVWAADAALDRPVAKRRELGSGLGPDTNS